MSPLFLLPAAWLIDLLFGDPHWLYHPVQLVGAAITRCEYGLRRLVSSTPCGERAGGLALAAVLPLLFLLLTGGILIFLYRLHPLLALFFDTLLSASLLATHSLRRESMSVFHRLREGDLPAARKAVGRIVGRDSQGLDEAGIARAAVETVAENTSDGVVAPLLYMAIGGSPLAMWYKSVNTLDSMVGYKNERYLHFGRASAKLDDIANFIPARVSAWLMLLSASFLPGCNGRKALHIYRRDRHNHQSPNSAHTEAICAGALGIQLGGDAVYFGQLHHKPTIGDPVQPIQPDDIRRANQLMLLTSLLALLTGTLLRWLVITIFL